MPREIETEIVAAGEVRGSLTHERDLQGLIDFQNDVNALLARVEQMQMPWRSLSDLNPPPPPSAVVADATPLPVVRPAAVRIGRLASLVVANPPLVRRSS